jgi:hypothetical protein
MKLACLLSLSLLAALALLLGAAPIARTVESLNTLNDAEPTEPPSLSAFDGSLAPSAIQSPAGGWEIECVDCPKQFEFMTERSLQLDSEGHPHIAAGGNHLYYARSH